MAGPDEVGHGESRALVCKATKGINGYARIFRVQDKRRRQAHLAARLGRAGLGWVRQGKTRALVSETRLTILWNLVL
jgi:hypothetical protein